MVHYNPKLDRSKEMGWRMVCDEPVPTAQEQEFWARVMIVYTLATVIMLFII
jgi:hypothetical protein